MGLGNLPNWEGSTGVSMHAWPMVIPSPETSRLDYWYEIQNKTKIQTSCNKNSGCRERGRSRDSAESRTDGELENGIALVLLRRKCDSGGGYYRMQLTGMR
jgi:hypothetical protein